MTFAVGGHASEKKSRGLRTDTRDLEVQDGEDVDVLRRPGPEIGLVKVQAFHLSRIQNGTSPKNTGPLNPDQYEVNHSLKMTKKVFFVVTKLKLI